MNTIMNLLMLRIKVNSNAFEFDFHLSLLSIFCAEVTIKQLREKIKELEDRSENTLQVSSISCHSHSSLIFFFFFFFIQQRLKEKEKELQRLFGKIHSNTN